VVRRFGALKRVRLGSMRAEKRGVFLAKLANPFF
jgi:hypothetical protein